jgi:plastocyanin
LFNVNLTSQPHLEGNRTLIAAAAHAQDSANQVRRIAMQRKSSARSWVVAFLLGGGAGLIGIGTLSTLAQSHQYLVSQKGREFSPHDLTVRVGDTVVIVNDDGDLRHHAYIDSDNFTFDSGDQEPGSRTPINFTVKGDFDVLCAIHPKMSLLVHVK